MKNGNKVDTFPGLAIVRVAPDLQQVLAHRTTTSYKSLGSDFYTIRIPAEHIRITLWGPHWSQFCKRYLLLLIAWQFNVEPASQSFLPDASRDVDNNKDIISNFHQLLNQD